MPFRWEFFSRESKIKGRLASLAEHRAKGNKIDEIWAILVLSEKNPIIAKESRFRDRRREVLGSLTFVDGYIG